MSSVQVWPPSWLQRIKPSKVDGIVDAGDDDIIGGKGVDSVEIVWVAEIENLGPGLPAIARFPYLSGLGSRVTNFGRREINIVNNGAGQGRLQLPVVCLRGRGLGGLSGGERTVSGEFAL